ncbi:MAG: DUF4403 family protein [Chitinophagaceae bacterium]|nr:DUF4403 family protein [Chitinophagaceae bacterium]
MLRQFLPALSCFIFLQAAGQEVVVPQPMTSLPSLQESVIHVPVKLYARPYLQQAEAMTPKEFLSEGWPEFLASGCEFRYKYRFVRSGLGLSCVNNKMTITFSGSYQIAGSETICAFGKQMSPWVTGSCGFGSEPMRKVQISIQSFLEFQPNYTLKTTTLPEKVTALDKCMVTIFNSDVTKEVIDSIGASVAAFGNSLDQKIAGLNFSSTLQVLAEKVGKKIPLNNYGYIKLNPSSVRAGRVNFTRDTLYFTLGVSCFPELSSDSINASITSFLPPLTSTELNPGFRINTNAIYDYVTLDTILNRSFRNTSFDLGGRTMILKNVAVSGLDNNQVELRIDFEGDKKGTVYLTGTPLLDVKNQVITIPDLDYSLRSRDLILNVAKTLFNKKILATLRENGTIRINEIYIKNKARIDSAFNRTISTELSTAGRSSGFSVTGLVIKRDNLLLQTNVTGDLSILVK